MSDLLRTKHIPNVQILLPDSVSKDDKHRLQVFAGWLDDIGRTWQTPDLAAYRDFLLRDYTGRDGKPLAVSSVKAHLATIRGRYRSILRDNHTRDILYAMTPIDATPSDRKAFVDETLERIRNAVDPETAPVKTRIRQDVPDTDHLRLTAAQASALLNAPGVDTMLGLRDTAIIAVMLCTGIREAELCALDVIDLRQTLGGALALHVREGKGCKERLVPYGDMDFVLVIIETWQQAAGIMDGAIFRGFYKGGKHVRSSHITVRAINQILDRYPIPMNGMVQRVNPHDLRRTYARRLYEAGVDLLAIQQNLGHAEHKTTEKYIGSLDASARKPPALYNFDLSQLRLLL